MPANPQPPQSAPQNPCAPHLVPFQVQYRRATFYHGILQALQGLLAQHGGAFPVGTVFQHTLRPRGFAAQGYLVKIDLAVPNWFFCDHEDVNNWYPARLKNAAAALLDAGQGGCFRMTHNPGPNASTLVINRLA